MILGETISREPTAGINDYMFGAVVSGEGTLLGTNEGMPVGDGFARIKPILMAKGTDELNTLLRRFPISTEGIAVLLG